MAGSAECIKIIAQPKELHRDRYGKELNKFGNIVQRFIRAEENNMKLEYPTIEIPEHWYGRRHYTYIRVSLVTVTNEDVTIACQHPYPIETNDPNAFKDSIENAIYFPITNEDIMNGQKSFRLIRKRLLQNDVLAQFPLRIYNSYKRYIPPYKDRWSGNKLIRKYKLWKSQLVFSRAERISNTTFHILHESSVFSTIMSDELQLRREKQTVESIVETNDSSDKRVVCVPDRGNWNGGDTVVMTLKELIRDKALRIYFDYPECNHEEKVNYEMIDTKTIMFKTPPIRLQITEQHQRVSIVAMQEGKMIGNIGFLYLSPNITTAAGNCLSELSEESCLSYVDHDLDNFQAISSIWSPEYF